MRRSRLLRRTAMAAVTALIVAGCGLASDPVVSTEQEVTDALLELRDGARVRVTAELELDQDEVRGVLRDDPEARRLFAEVLDDETADTEALVADLEAARSELAEHAVLLGIGADDSVRIAAEHQSVVWADLRVRTDLEPGVDPTDGVPIDLQLQVDWATAAEVVDERDLLGDLDEAARELAPFLGGLPDVQPVQELLLAFLAGELVGVGGRVTPDLLGGLGVTGDGPQGATGPWSDLGPGALDLDLQELVGTALVVDGYRVDGDATLVDVTLELRAVAELLLERLAEHADTTAGTVHDVEQLRAELDELPDRLVDVATLRFDAAGTLDRARIDLLDASLQLARASDPDDADLVTIERVAGQLDATGLFVVVDVQDVGQTETVLGEPTTTVTPEEFAAAFGALLFGGLGDIGGLDDIDDLGDIARSDHGAGADLGADGAMARALRPGDLAVGDCFDDAALFGFQQDGATPTVPCAEPHDNEAFATVTADSHEELTRDESDAVACLDAFTDYVGVAYEGSVLVVDVIRPTEREFATGDRSSVCYLYGDETLTGSVAGTGR